LLCILRGRKKEVTMSDRIWYVYPKSQEVNQFVIQNCIGFDPDTDCVEEARVHMLGPNGEDKTEVRKLLRINKEMVDLLKRYGNRFGNNGYEIYVQESSGAKINLWIMMYKFKSDPSVKKKIRRIPDMKMIK
jgi:hypothetical protein